MTQPRRMRPPRTGRPAREANFLPKRERKQVRKSMVRAYLANRISEARVGRQDRAEFYRNLRYMKIRRRQIAQQMQVLGDLLEGLYREVGRVPDRYPDADLKLADEAEGLAARAAVAVETAAVELHAFARRRIYYTEAM